MLKSSTTCEAEAWMEWARAVTSAIRYNSRLVNRDSDTIIILSPAKSLDYDTPPRTKTHTSPNFIECLAELTGVFRRLPPAQIDTLIHIPDPLAAFNTTRYADWSPKFTAENSKQATLALDDDVCGGLDINSLVVDGLQFVQKYLRVLSGLYGVLRPLDRMQLYRLEMGTRLASPRDKDLYAFWSGKVVLAPNKLFKQNDNAMLVNLAPKEYFKVVRPKVLKARITMSVFENRKNGQYKIVSFYARRTCGLMACYAIEHHIIGPRKLKTFNADGHAFVAVDSDSERWIFRRRSTR